VVPTNWEWLKRVYLVPHARLGWLLIAFGIFMWLMFGRYADWSSLRFYRQPTRQIAGIVVDVAPSGFRVGEYASAEPILALSFEFSDLAGIRRRGKSWTEKCPPNPGDQVQIEFLPSQPTISRIVHARSGPLPLSAGAVLLFPVIGVTCILQAMLTSQGALAGDHSVSREDMTSSKDL
jgi:hypothetical protein